MNSTILITGGRRRRHHHHHHRRRPCRRGRRHVGDNDDDEFQSVTSISSSVNTLRIRHAKTKDNRKMETQI